MRKRVVTCIALGLSVIGATGCGDSDQSSSDPKLVGAPTYDKIIECLHKYPATGSVRVSKALDNVNGYDSDYIEARIGGDLFVIRDLESYEQGSKYLRSFDLQSGENYSAGLLAERGAGNIITVYNPNSSASSHKAASRCTGANRPIPF